MSTADLLDVAAAGIAGLFGLLAVVGCLVTLATRFAVGRYARRAAAAPLASYPAVTLLKPLHGDEPGLAANLASFFHQDYPAPVEIVFGASRADDPALAIAHRLALETPAISTRIVADAARHGRNGKVSNLVNMQRAASHPVVVLADSDMRVEPGYLRQVVDALHAPGVGLVTCLYRGATLPNLWSRLTAAGIDFHFLPSVLFGLTLGLAKPCFGSTIALRRQTLDEVGGFLAFKDILADDNAVGQAVRQLGLRVAVPRAPVLDHLCTATSFRATFRQDLRWSRTIRAVDPAGFAGSIVTNPLPLAIIAWLFGGFGVLGAAIVLAALACRLALQLRICQFIGVPARLVRLGPLRDVLSFAVFAASFWPGSLHWRGEAFAVDAAGTMAPPGHTGS